ncbi:flagellar hook-basal body protein [Niallia sp. NCCP-28]|uniref:flagellar hook-basal body protein n=1 Tax=Niallia sp. NCCP-28 TaxID=2934712 RepID=UPI002085BA21|nr:flagellar hook-basal body protein [Niallia sp. NCCP-28]GKU83649.1 flagellar hook-basal body complex protein FlhO [Niallia sp. NCCP-28]
MFKGFYTAASGMLAQQRKTEMLTNNVANSNTPGFKADNASIRTFPELLQTSVEKSSAGATKKTEIGSLATGVYMQEAIPNFVQGDMRDTGLKTDIALVDINVPGNEDNKNGSLFFNVQNADGDMRYTRNGNFMLNSQGFLTTADGFYVLDENNNAIELPDENFTVSDDGMIMGSNGEAFRLGVSYTDNPQNLIKEGNGLYRQAEEAGLGNAYTSAGVDFQLKQGYLESSNVDTSKSMTEMMTAYRSFEANQKILQAYDQSMEKAANEIGKI